MKITAKGCALSVATVVASAWLLTQADRISAVTPGPAAVHVAVNPQHLPPYWHSEAPTWCQEDMPCWIGSNDDSRTDRASMADWIYQLRHAHNYERPVPRWLSCNTIDGSEFPHKAAVAWHICYRNINYWGARWNYVGRYDRHDNVWAIAGPTTVYVTRAGWFETS